VASRIARARRGVAAREHGQIFVGFLHQQGSAGGRATAADSLGLQHSDADAGVSEPPGHCRAGESAADNRHVDIGAAAKHWKTRSVEVGVARSPERLTHTEAWHPLTIIGGALASRQPTSPARAALSPCGARARSVSNGNPN
jgi:hypothetical protein